MRLPAALFGWVGIALTYWAFAPTVGRRTAAAAALVLATSSWHMDWSQTARFYTLEIDLTTSSLEPGGVSILDVTHLSNTEGSKLAEMSL